MCWPESTFHIKHYLIHSKTTVITIVFLGVFVETIFGKFLKSISGEKRFNVNQLKKIKLWMNNAFLIGSFEAKSNCEYRLELDKKSKKQ